MGLVLFVHKSALTLGRFLFPKMFLTTFIKKTPQHTHTFSHSHTYSDFFQSAVQFMPLIHPFTHTFTHQRRLAAMQGTNQLVRSNWGLGVLLRDRDTPGWDRTGNPPTARRQLLPPEPYRDIYSHMLTYSGRNYYFIPC